MHRWSRRVCTPPEWEWTGQRRVLVEGPDAWAWVVPLREAGCEAIACRGPDPDEQCPLLAFGVCATAAAAHEIASQLGEVECALRAHYPFTPVHARPEELLPRAVAR